MEKKSNSRGVHNSSKGGSQKRFKVTVDATEKISETQADIYTLFTKYGLTAKQIASRRKTSPKAVYKILNKLAQKGLIQKHLKGGFTKIDPTPQKKIKNIIKKKAKPQHFIRLHFLEVHIQILYDSSKYQTTIGKSNLLRVYNNTILLFKNKIQIYLTESASGEDVSRATAIAFTLLDKVVNKLENDLHIILRKNRVCNAKIVNWHYSETDNELAQELNEKKKKLRIYSRFDGLLWFQIDDSFNLNEAECVHPETAKEDMQIVKDFFDDLRQKPTTMSRIESKFDSFLNKALPIQQKFAKDVNLHLDVLTRIGQGIDEFRDEVRIMRLQRQFQEIQDAVRTLKRNVCKVKQE